MVRYCSEMAWELSTSSPFTGAQEDNRSMNATNPAGGLGRFLTLADAAEVLSISPQEVLGLVRSGELPAIKVGSKGHWRIEKSVLESYIEALYEETRRMSLWNQSDIANVTEINFGEQRERSTFSTDKP
jgi:excisionase family DNA binding protein